MIQLLLCQPSFHTRFIRLNYELLLHHPNKNNYWWSHFSIFIFAAFLGSKVVWRIGLTDRVVILLGGTICSCFLKEKLCKKNFGQRILALMDRAWAVVISSTQIKLKSVKVELPHPALKL